MMITFNGILFICEVCRNGYGEKIREYGIAM